ncbi:autotransporter-associated beta strand repeat-containing protein [Pontiella desulfatans]|nr:autotransporter-associated beta strand repeat-containing protein [Pontiella desulfatans]
MTRNSLIHWARSVCNHALFLPTLLLAFACSGAHAVTISTTKWQGDTSANWFTGSNWSVGVPSEDVVAIFTTDFTSGNSQPTVTAADIIDEIRIIQPAKDVTITIPAGTSLSVDNNTGLDGRSISMNAARKNLTIIGDGTFVQRNANGDSTWLITSGQPIGDLTIETAALEIESQTLTISAGSARTVNIVPAVSPTTAGIKKTGSGRLILHGQNQWSGPTTISNGTLEFGTNQAVSSSSPVVFNNNAVLEPGGHDGQFSTLAVNSHVVFDFESTGASHLAFADSSSIAWTTPNLIITNFTPGTDSIRFGTTAGGLSPAQLAGITLNGSSNLALLSSGYLAFAPDFATVGEYHWDGDSGHAWETASNWISNAVPPDNAVALFDTPFSAPNAQPTIHAGTGVDELRVLAPEKDVVLTIVSNTLFNIGHNTEGNHHAIEMASATRALTILGQGHLAQGCGEYADPLWNITGAGDLTISPAQFSISNNVALTINTGAERTVGINTACNPTLASVRKTGAGRLILSGQNQWQGKTTVDAGTLRFATHQPLDASSALILNAGSILETGGHGGTFSTLEVNGPATLDFGNAGTSQLAFLDSSAETWSLPTLTITNFTQGTDSIRFGTDQLTLDADGYLVVEQPEPIQEYYIDPALGDETHPGTETEPFRTIEQARDAVRLINGAMTKDIVVYLRGGTYAVEQTIELDERDSGTNGFNIIYRNYPNEAPILEGGVPITGWTPLSNGIWQAGVGDFEFLQLYVNNRLAQRARFPESGQENEILNNDKINKKVKINKGQISNWSNLNRVQMVIGRSFTLARLRIDSIEEYATFDKVIPMEPERTNFFNADGPLDGSPSFYYENHFSFLDTPGEWFLDVDTGTVYYMPRPGEDLSVMEAIAPATERLLSIENAENITLFGLTFQHSAWNAPATEGMAQRQAGMRITLASKFTVNPSAVYFKRINDVRVERCIFRQMGVNAVNFDVGTRDNVMVGNVFSEIADTGIVYDIDNKRGQSGADLSLDDTFDSNYFFHMGNIYYGGGAMFTFWPDSISIVHNEIAYTGGLGLNLGWGATHATTCFQAPYVAYNRIHDAAVWCRDSGAIHTKSDSSGGVIYKNWIYNVNTVDWWKTGPSRTINGIHLDDNTENYTIQDNVFMNCESYDIRTKEGVNDITMLNNGGQSQATKDESGLRMGYRDIKNFHQGGAIGRDLMPGELYTGAPSAPLSLLFEDLFDSEATGAAPAGYSVATASGCTASISDVPGGGNRSLRMDDGNSGDVGVDISKSFIPQSERVSCEFRVKPGQTGNNLFFSFRDAEDREACQVGFSASALLRYYYRTDNYENLGGYSTDTWYTIRVEADVEQQLYSVWVNGNLAMGDALFMNDQRTGNLAERVESIDAVNLYNSYGTGHFDIDYIRVEGDAPYGLSTEQGTPRSWLDTHHDTSGWTAADFELFDFADVDGDGKKGWEEWTAGTDPNNSGSIFKISDTAANSGLSLSWNSVAGRYYTVQSAENPDGPWNNVADAAYVNKPGTGSTIHYFEGTLPDNHRFFRIVASPTE